MSVGSVLTQSIVSGLMAASFLLTNAQANPQPNPQPDTQTDPMKSVVDIPEHRQCGELSSLFQKLGDSYYDFPDHPDAVAPSAMEIEENKLLSHLMEMRVLKGWGSRVDCRGSGDHMKTRAFDVSLKDISARWWQDSDLESGVFVRVYEYDRPTGRLGRESVTIPTRPGEVLYLNPDTIVSGTRHRKATTTGSYLRETLIHASLAGTTVVIDQSVYVNGTLTQWNTWHLED